MLINRCLGGSSKKNHTLDQLESRGGLFSMIYPSAYLDLMVKFLNQSLKSASHFTHSCRNFLGSKIGFTQLLCNNQ